MSALTKPAEFDSIRALLVRYAARLQDKNDEPPGQFLIAHAFLRAVELIDLLALRAEDADQFRSTLELIAGSAADKLQGLQARSALDRARPPADSERLQQVLKRINVFVREEIEDTVRLSIDGIEIAAVEFNSAAAGALLQFNAAQSAALTSGECLPKK